MVIAAIDPGSQRCGYCLLAPENGRLKALDIGTVTASAKSKSGRLLEVHNRIAELFERHRPTAVVVERAYVGVNPQSAIVLGEARGLALICAERVGAEVFEYTAPEAKQALTANGLSSKAGVARVVQLLLGLSAPLPPDSSDAVALALLHASRTQLLR